VKLQLNSLGTPESRAVYREQLPPISARTRPRSTKTAGGGCTAIRCESSTARIPTLQRIVAGAPLLDGSLDAESKAHFASLCAHLQSAGIEYHVNPRLVRGLDYYTRTVFEWITDSLGSQSTVCAGGRYDGLIAQLGGTATPGIGWAMGQERIVMLLEKLGCGGRRPAAGLFGDGRGTVRAFWGSK
jgi:histidyl-tRNA synthetase